MAYYGYHRISTKEQHLDRGIIEIKRFCENQKIKLESIFTDKITGKNFDRPRYTVLVEDVLRVGDTLIITELDRLGRNKQEILKQLRFLEEKGVRVMVLELPTTLFDLSQMENNLAKMMIESLMRGSTMRESVTDVRIILECLQEAYQMEGDMVRSGKNIHATMIYPFVRMLQEKCRDLTEEQIHKTLWKEYEISGADRMFVERASKILEPYEGESEDEK